MGYGDDKDQLAPEIVLGARQLRNPDGIAPRMDTEGPPPSVFSGGGQLMNIPPAKLSDQGDTSNPPAAEVSPGMMREAGAPASKFPGDAAPIQSPAAPPDTSALSSKHQAPQAPMGQPGLAPLDQSGLAGHALQQEGQARHAAKMREFGDAEAHLNAALMKSPDEFSNPTDYTKYLTAITAGHGALRSAKAEYELAHPWGSMESSHPGIMGKIGHAFGEIGNVAGEALAPGVAAAIPSSREHMLGQEAKGEAEVGQAVKEQGEAIGGEQKQAAADKAEAQAAVQPSVEQKNIAQAGLADTKADLAAPKAENEAIHDLMTGNEGGGARTNPLTGKPYTYAEAYGAVKGLGKPAPTAKQQHVAGTLNGAPAMEDFNPATGEYTNPDTHEKVTGFKPAPNYAQVLPKKLETQTKNLVGPDGIAHDYGWNPQTNRYDIDMGVSGSGQQGSRLFASGVSKAGADTLIHDIQANRAKLGSLEAWVKSKGLDTPIADPVLARLQSELASFAALQPAQHGFRATTAMEAFEKIIGGLQKNPDATIESIKGINEVTSQALPKTAPGGAKNAPAAPAAPSEGGRQSVADWLKNRQARTPK
jgi:hypothetical protein